MTPIAWLVLVWALGAVLVVLWVHTKHPTHPDLYDLPAPIILGCLDCRGDLERWEQWFRCVRCGIYYNPELLAETPGAIWYRIQEGRMICRECPQTLPDIPRIHVDEYGNPIPCPIHGPAPER